MQTLAAISPFQSSLQRVIPKQDGHIKSGRNRGSALSAAGQTRVRCGMSARGSGGLLWAGALGRQPCTRLSTLFLPVCKAGSAKPVLGLLTHRTAAGPPVRVVGLFAHLLSHMWNPGELPPGSKPGTFPCSDQAHEDGETSGLADRRAFIFIPLGGAGEGKGPLFSPRPAPGTVAGRSASGTLSPPLCLFDISKRGEGGGAKG